MMASLGNLKFPLNANDQGVNDVIVVINFIGDRPRAVVRSHAVIIINIYTDSFIAVLRYPTLIVRCMFVSFENVKYIFELCDQKPHERSKFVIVGYSYFLRLTFSNQRFNETLPIGYSPLVRSLVALSRFSEFGRVNYIYILLQEKGIKIRLVIETFLV